MEVLAAVQEKFLMLIMVGLAIAICFCLIRALLGPRFTDRIIAVNLISTKTIILICILAFYIGEQYLVDVAVVYALISFLAVVVLANVYQSAYNKRKAEKDAKAAETLAEEETV